MGFFSRLFSKLKRKDKQTVDAVAEANAKNQVVFYDANQKSFDDGLRKSATALDQSIAELLVDKKIIMSDEWYDNLEDALVSYDVGYTAANKIVDAIRNEIAYQNVDNPKLIKEIILDKLLTYYIQDTEINTNFNLENDRTNVILVVGANGVGKTTSIAKIAKYFVDKNKKVLLVAGDTFRAGAVEQLGVWSERLGCDIVKPNKANQDPASVVYEGMKKGYDEQYDLIIVDTSGRLQNKTNLLNELKKIYNIIHKFDKNAPHESLLVMDATTGQSGLSQAKAFNECAELSGIILAKMDSTSHGGIVLAIKDAFNVPVKMIGLGEQLDDLKPFDLERFIDGLVADISYE